MNRPTVLILASSSGFAREITANWPRDHVLQASGPDFIVLDHSFSGGLASSHYDLAIADASSLRKKNRNKSDELPDKGLKQLFAASGKPAIVIHSGRALDLYTIDGAVIVLRRTPGIWAALAGLIGREMLRRSQAENRAREAGQLCAAAQAEATLGRYMIEMRTNINNALTTVLGNAELLAHEPGLPASAQAQADAIRNMALRLNEVFQRFSSIEKELSVAARDPGKKTARAAGC